MAGRALLRLAKNGSSLATLSCSCPFSALVCSFPCRLRFHPLPPPHPPPPTHELPLRYTAICVGHATTATPAIFVWDRLEALVLNKPIPIPPIIRATKVGTPSYRGDASLPRPPSTPTGDNPAYSASVVLRSCISRVSTRRARSLPIQSGERTSCFDGAHVTSPSLVLRATRHGRRAVPL